MSARLFIAEDGYSDLCVWENGANPFGPDVVLHLNHVNDAELRRAIVALVEGGGVE